jgi:hypothetical protein
LRRPSGTVQRNLRNLLGIRGCVLDWDLHLRNGEDKKAIKEYLRAAEFDANEDLVTRAIAIYKRVLSIDPDHIEAIHRMAALFSKEGLLGDARGLYEKTLKICKMNLECGS